VPEELEFVFEDGSSEHLLATPVALNLYRLEESSALGEAVFGDVIEAEKRLDGRLHFKAMSAP
jgi:hypothetical protein